MASKKDLGHALKLKFGLAPDQPTERQIDAIINHISKIPLSDRTDDKWLEIVRLYVPDKGKHGYFGLDTSDLNAIYAQIQATLKRRK